MIRIVFLEYGIVSVHGRIQSGIRAAAAVLVHCCDVALLFVFVQVLYDGPNGIDEGVPTGGGGLQLG